MEYITIFFVAIILVSVSICIFYGGLKALDALYFRHPILGIIAIIMAIAALVTLNAFLERLG